MYSEIKISELKDRNDIEHKIITDGLSYEIDKYIFDAPKEIEITRKYEYINFDSPIKEIHKKYRISEAIYTLEIILENRTHIYLTYTYENTYRIRIYENAMEKEMYMNNRKRY